MSKDTTQKVDAFEAAVDEVKSVAADLKASSAEARKMAEKAEAEIKNLGNVREETKSQIDKALADVNPKILALSDKMVEAKKAADERLLDLEQKVARGIGGGAIELPKSLGEQIVENVEMKALCAAGRGKAHIKTTMTLAGTTTVGATVSAQNSLIVADRQALVPTPAREMTVRDLISPGRTNSSFIEWPKETSTVTDSKAGVVSEGVTKAYTNFTFDLVKASVTTIAVMTKASRQILDDSPMLQSFCNERLPVLLAYTEEKELLTGDGTGQHLYGLVSQATTYSGAFSVTSEKDTDRVRLAILQAATALYPPTGIVMHPQDWARIEMTKDTLGRYIIGDPQAVAGRRLWGLPVVPSFAMSSGYVLVGAFKLGAQIFDRLGVEVLVSTENDTDFEKNLISIRCEERLALAVYRPGAFIYGTLPQ